MVQINQYINNAYLTLPGLQNKAPWEITSRLSELLTIIIADLGHEFSIKNGIAIHHSAVIENNVTLKPPVVIGENCFIGANAYLRGGVYLANSSGIGPGCEVKSSIIFDHSALAHFNFIGDSIIGSHVNFEAGSITANHFNERENKDIYILVGSEIVNTGSRKFGALVGDHSRIGANAVLSPGTILLPGSIVKRLELVDQVGEGK